MKKILFLFLFLSFCKINSQTYVTIPDANFVSYLQSQLPSAMNGYSLNITSTLVTTATKTLSLSFQSITNLNGVQYFSSLKKLSCSGNSLTTLPNLPNSLVVLECNNNSITSLSSLPNSINWFDCSHNFLTSLPNVPDSINYFACWSNSLTSLPVLPNKLTHFSCGYNHLTNLPALSNSLIVLSCAGNSLTTLPGLPNSLISIDCGFNSLTSLPTLPNSLYSLHCENNNIACFPTFPNSIMSSSGPGYYIGLDNNPFTCLPNYLPGAMSPSLMAYPLCAAGNANGCDIAAGEAENFLDQTTVVYPNPAKSFFTLEITNSEKHIIQICDLNGKSLVKQELNGKTTIDVTSLDEGVYNLRIKTKDHIVNKKLVIVR